MLYCLHYVDCRQSHAHRPARSRSVGSPGPGAPDRTESGPARSDRFGSRASTFHPHPGQAVGHYSAHGPAVADALCAGRDSRIAQRCSSPGPTKTHPVSAGGSDRGRYIAHDHPRCDALEYPQFGARPGCEIERRGDQRHFEVVLPCLSRRPRHDLSAACRPRLPALRRPPIRTSSLPHAL